MASTGQTSTHCSQAMQRAGSMKNCGSSSEEAMQSTGQTSTHVPSFTPMHGSVMT